MKNSLRIMPINGDHFRPAVLGRRKATSPYLGVRQPGVWFSRPQVSTFWLFMAFLVIACSCSSSLAPAQTVRSRLGVHLAHGDLIDPANVNLLQQLGVSFVRYDVWWDSVETTKGVYDWSGYDPYFQAASNAGLNVLAILDYNNPLYAAQWNSGFTKQSDINGYTNYVVAALRHYNNASITWELYNEPNQPDFWRSPSATNYMNLLKAAIPAMKAAVPTANIIAPALGHNPRSNPAPWQDQLLDFPYLQSCLNLNLLNYDSVISVHPYPGGAPESLVTTYADLWNLVNQYTQAKPVSFYSSETGYLTGTGGVTEAQQGDWIPRQVLINLNQKIAATVLFELRDSASDGNYGLVRSDGTLKPAYLTLQTLLQQVGDLSYQTRLSSSSSDWLLQFGSPAKTVVAGWTTGTSHTVTINGRTMTLASTPSYLQTSP